MKVDDLLKQRDVDKKRLCELCERNAKLELDMKNVLNANVNLDGELTQSRQELTFVSAELSKQEKLVEQLQVQLQAQCAQNNEIARLREGELERVSSEHKREISERDVALVKLKDAIRQRETQLDETRSRMKVLEEELHAEHEAKVKCERMLEQHKSETRELQIKLDECFNETKRLVFLFPLILVYFN